MFNRDTTTNENNKEHNEKWPYIPDHPYRILIIGGSGSGKTNAMLNLIKEQVWTFDQKSWKRRHRTFKQFKSIYWVFKYNGWRLSEYWWL